MSDGWYYAKNGQQVGPVNGQQIAEMLRTGQLSFNDLAWQDGMTNWVPLSSIPEFQGLQGGLRPQAGPAQPNYYAGSAMAGQTPPPNYLVQAILVTICCCLPFGIVSIVYAAQVNGKFQSGDVQGAYNSSNTAKTWAWWGFGIGIAVNVLAFGAQFAIESSKF